MRHIFGSLTAVLLVTACIGDPSDPGGPVSSQVPPPTAVASVSMRMATAQIAVGETVQLGATPRTITGAVTGARAVLWRSNAANIAAVDQNALVLGVSPGLAVITVNIDGSEGQTTVTVTAPGR